MLNVCIPVTVWMCVDSVLAGVWSWLHGAQLVLRKVKYGSVTKSRVMLWKNEEWDNWAYSRLCHLAEKTRRGEQRDETRAWKQREKHLFSQWCVRSWILCCWQSYSPFQRTWFKNGGKTAYLYLFYMDFHWGFNRFSSRPEPSPKQSLFPCNLLIFFPSDSFLHH